MKNLKIVLACVVAAAAAALAMTLINRGGQGNAGSIATSSTPGAAPRSGAPAVAASDSAADNSKAGEALEARLKQADELAKALNAAVEESKNYREQQLLSFSRSESYVKGFVAASAFKVGMVEYYQTEGKWPATNKDIGLNEPASFEVGNLKSVGIAAGGQVKIVYAAAAGKTETLSLQGVANPNGQVSWTCVTSDISDIASIVPGCAYRAP